jgi:hypothetical protein
MITNSDVFMNISLIKKHDIMRKLHNILIVILIVSVFISSCSREEDLIPKNDISSISNSSHDGLLKSALKFEAIHGVPLPSGGQMPEMPMPQIISQNGNRFRFKAPIMTLIGDVEPSEAAAFLAGGFIIVEMEAFWKVPNSDPTRIMEGTGPAKGEFFIKRGQPDEEKIIWKGTINGVRINLRTVEDPLFQWKGHINAVGVGEYEGLKLTARETTNPGSGPAMTYFWSGVITPSGRH